MLDTPEIKNIYKEIQKKLFYMVPEKWDSLYLYASIVEKAYQMPIGEMYFYYFPKGLLKRDAINVYQIPSKFNIEEQEYMKLVKSLYSSINSLREEYKKNKHRLWTNITISIENFKFKIEYNYDAIDSSEASNYERHIIWRYKYLKEDVETLNRKERKIINKYFSEKNDETKKDTEVYEEGLYKRPIHNIMEYNKAESNKNEKTNVMKEIEADNVPTNNQILALFNKK